MSVNHTKNIIEVNNLSFSYEKNEVLRDVSLHIHAGDYLGIIGPNGGGKTTLIKIILGLLKPDHGAVEMFGQPLSTFKDWQKIGYVAQKATHFDPNFPATVLDVVMMGRVARRGLFRRFTEQDKKDAHWALQQVGLENFTHRLIGNLSGGEQQRVLIARALAQKPEIIFLDEPTSGVDTKSQEQFYALLKKLNTELHITLVLISHDVDVIANEVTEIACINQTLVYHGSPEGITEEEQRNALYAKGLRFIVHKH